MIRAVFLLSALLLQDSSALSYVSESYDAYGAPVHDVYGSDSESGPDVPPLYNCSALATAYPFELAYGIKHCLDRPLHTDQRASLSQLKTALSESVRNAVFLNEVCIVNKKFPEYLYSPADGYKYTGSSPQTRRVFTWIGDAWDHKGKGDWKLIRHEGDNFFIVSVEYGEFLTATDEVVKNRRQVSTIHVSPSWLLENQERVLWTLETWESFVYLKNVLTKEYLYAVNGLNYDANRRAVTTWSSDDNGCVGDDQCFWSIKPC